MHSSKFYFHFSDEVRCAALELSGIVVGKILENNLQVFLFVMCMVPSTARNTTLGCAFAVHVMIVNVGSAAPSSQKCKAAQIQSGKLADYIT